jgi:hypothetical protein
VAVVAHNGLTLELETDASLLITEILLRTDLLDTRETRFIRDKLVNTVYHDRQAGGVRVGSSSKARASLESRAFNIDGLGHVKEPGLFTDLSEICLAEGLLDNDVE